MIWIGFTHLHACNIVVYMYNIINIEQAVRLDECHAIIMQYLSH